MSHKLVLRFDIDTHKCIRDGVPNLLDLADKYDVPFTFFLNTGKAVALFDSMFKSKAQHIESAKDNKASNAYDEPQMMTARQKFGNIDFVEAAIINPKLTHYKKQIMRLFQSKSEMGIHGGRNHALWQKYGADWDYAKTRDEVEYALEQIRWIVPEYTPLGFLSPGWNSPKELDKVLYDLGFLYCADLRAKDETDANKLIDTTKRVPYLGTNLLHEPGAVAFFEGCRVQGMNNDKILRKVTNSLRDSEITVIYDHPYYSGVRELKLIEQIIQKAKEMDVEIVTMSQLAR